MSESRDSSPPAPPGAAAPRFRESAAVVLTRGRGESLEVYWVLRSQAVSYMPGLRAFLGGKVDPADLELPLEDAEGLSGVERAMRACAIREAYEEAGVLVGLAAPVDDEPLMSGRALLLDGKISFVALAQMHGWRFRAGAIDYAGRWTTPAFTTQRFDTMFFLATVPRDQVASVIPGELERGDWVRPGDALAAYRAGRERFAAPILHVLRELEAGGEGLIERLTAGPEASAQPIRRIELQWGVVLQPMKTRPLPPATHTNAYLVGDREMALIDPGSDAAEDLEALDRLLATLAVEGRRLRIVLLTHFHSDHVAGAQAVRERYGVKVAAHAETAQHVRVDFAIGDREWIPLAGEQGDWNLRALHTPGHTRGHLCFFHERSGALFTGDHIPGGGGTVIIDPPEGDMAAYLASLEKLKALPIVMLFPGHGSPQGAAHRRIQWLIDHRLEREARVLAALGASPAAATLADLVPHAYADVKPELWPYAERSLLAHLEKLEHEGKARREGERWART